MADEEHDTSQNPIGDGAESPPADPQASAESQPETGDGQTEAEAMAEAALRSAQEAIAAVTDTSATADSPAEPAEPPTSAPPPIPSTTAEPTSYETPDLTPVPTEPLPRGLDLLSDVNVDVAIELGRTHMLVEDVLRLAEGAVVELDKLAGDPVDIYVNQRLIARGEVLVLNDNFCIRVNDILDSDQVERES